MFLNKFSKKRFQRKLSNTTSKKPFYINISKTFSKQISENKSENVFKTKVFKKSFKKVFKNDFKNVFKLVREGNPKTSSKCTY